MKKIFLMACAVALTMTACENPVMDDGTVSETVSDGSPVGKTKKFTFTLKGDFSDQWSMVNGQRSIVNGQ